MPHIRPTDQSHVMNCTSTRWREYDDNTKQPAICHNCYDSRNFRLGSFYFDSFTAVDRLYFDCLTATTSSLVMEDTGRGAHGPTFAMKLVGAWQLAGSLLRDIVIYLVTKCNLNLHPSMEGSSAKQATQQLRL
ncbi:unnamed protein product, partial [Dovyalis caffra]